MDCNVAFLLAFIMQKKELGDTGGYIPKKLANH